MQIEWLDAACAGVREHPGDTVEIVIVPEFSLVRARYNRGASADTFGREDTLAPLHMPERVVIVLDRIFFENSARVGHTVPRLLEQPAAGDGFMCALGALLLHELKSGSVPTAAYLDSLAVIVSLHMAAHYCVRHAVMRRECGLSDEKLARVTRYVELHLGERITVRMLAALVHMSVFHFARLFKQATGTPPHLYITLARVERAKTLLRSTAQPIVEIAAVSGFQTQGHFTAVFHRHAHLTPRTYRLHGRGTIPSLERSPT
jgi:AraC family transcriptional regulator